jgi:hypothetical protein
VAQVEAEAVAVDAELLQEVLRQHRPPARHPPAALEAVEEPDAAAAVDAVVMEAVVRLRLLQLRRHR